jgi:hypothetical protein
MKLSVARRQAIQKTIDRIVHHFKVNARTRRKAGWPPKAHYWVRVFLQRNLGNTYDRIETAYGIDARTAKRWEARGAGKAVLDESVKRGEIKFCEIFLQITGHGPGERG